jgi:hypothetical protein
MVPSKKYQLLHIIGLGISMAAKSQWKLFGWLFI